MLEELITNLNSEERAKLPKFIATIGIVMANQENTKKVQVVLETNGISITTAKALRVLTIPVNDVKTRLIRWKQTGHFDLIENQPELLTYSCDSILKRIMICESNGKPYINSEGKVCTFILNQDEWDEVFKNYQTNGNQYNQKRPVATITQTEPSYQMDDNQYNRYQLIYQVLCLMFKAIIHRSSDLIGREQVTNYLIYLICQTDLSDEAIILRVLMDTKVIEERDAEKIRLSIERVLNQERAKLEFELGSKRAA